MSVKNGRHCQNQLHFISRRTQKKIFGTGKIISKIVLLFFHLLSIDSFDENSIVVIIPNPSIGNRWKKGVPSGNLPINFKGIKYLISMHPNETNNYRTLMHEIGHCYGSGRLYSIPNDMFHTEIFGLDMMGDSYFATGFMGYHRYRYGWMPFNKLNLKAFT